MNCFYIFLLFGGFFLSVNAVFQYHKVVLEPIFRFTDTAAVPMKSIYFTKLPQYLSVSQNTQHLNISQYNAVRGPTQEMFLKDLGCGMDTCQNLPIKVIPIYNAIDSKGRLKFETSPADSDTVLGKAGYISPEEHGGLIRYDEYYSEDVDMFAYTNGRYPNQFGACQLRDYGRYRYKFVRTIGYAFTAVTVPENLPIYSIFGYDDGLPEPTTILPSTVSLSHNQYIFWTNPIWTILKNSTNGTQGVGSINLPWTPPVSASPIEPTNVCLLSGNLSILSRCGQVDRMLQFFDKTHVYIGFIDSVYGAVDTFIYSYIGLAFKSQNNLCGIPVQPIREFYKHGVGSTVVAGDDYTDVTSKGFIPTGNIIGYTIDCNHAPNGQIVITIPDGLSTISTVSGFTSPTSSSLVGFYVEPVKIVGAPTSGGEQGYYLDPDGTPSEIDILDISNVCLFTANLTVVSRCGYASNLYLYYDVDDNFYFVGLYSFGRNVTSKMIGVAFENDENACGLNLVPIRELYKEGVGYNVVAGDEYSSLLANGFNITGNIVGYTVDCKDAKDNLVYGDMPAYEFSTTPSTSVSTSSVKPNSRDGFYVEPVVIIEKTVSEGEQGYSVNDGTQNVLNTSNVCIFTANSTVYSRCGFAKPLYLYYDTSDDFYFIGIQSYGREVTQKEIGQAFQTDENICGLDLVPIRELYKEGVGYYVVAGDDYSTLLSSGYTLTGNIMGYTVDCKDSIKNFVYGDIPDYDFTTLATTTGSSLPTVAPNLTDITSLYVFPLENVTMPGGLLGTSGFTSGSGHGESRNGAIPVCIFTANQSFLPFCGDARPLYQYFDLDSKFHFVGIQSFGRNVESTQLGLAFASSENDCGLKLRPMRELYKQGVGYTVVAGNNYAKLISDGYSLTGNILGYTVRCKDPVEKMICAHYPSNWTTTTVTTTPVSTTTTAIPTTTPYNLSAPLPKLNCDIIKNYGDLRWRMVQFERYMEVGDNFTMTGHIWPNASESNVNLYIGLNPKWLQSYISIHITMRWWRSDIIYNYFWGKWNYGLETFSSRPFAKGLPYVLSIVRGSNYYDVYGNGIHIKKYWIVGIVSSHSVGGMMGYREWTIDTVQMDCVQTSTTSASTSKSSTSTNPETLPTSILPTTLEASNTTQASTLTTSTTPTTSNTTLKTLKSLPATFTTAANNTDGTTNSSTISSTFTTLTTTFETPTTTRSQSTTRYNLSAPLPLLECNTISEYGDLRWRSVVFGRSMEVGDNITLTGYIWKNATDSNVNFYLGFNPIFGNTNIPLHISQRLTSTRNIYNNYWYQWGQEAYSPRVFTQGSSFVLSVVKTTNSYQIYGNGKLMINFGFRGTASQNAIGSLIAYREWTIDSVRMDCARPPTSTTPTTSTSPATVTSTTYPYNLTVPLPTLQCNSEISNYGNLLDRPVNFGRLLETGDNITLTGFVWGNATLSNMNFYLGFNPTFGVTVIPVHINQRWLENNVIIYNNYNSRWGDYQEYSQRPFTRGQPFVLSVIRTANSHIIYGNGEQIKVFNYRGDASINQIGSLIAYDHWTIDTVSMVCPNLLTTSTISSTTATSTTSTSTSTPTTSTTLTTTTPSTSILTTTTTITTPPTSAPTTTTSATSTTTPSPTSTSTSSSTSTTTTTSAATTPTTAPTTSTPTTATSTTTTVTSTTLTTSTTSTPITTKTPTTSTPITTTKLPLLGTCPGGIVTLSKGDSNDPQQIIDAHYGEITTSGYKSYMIVYCQSLPEYSIYMMFNVNQGGSAPTRDYQEVQLECSLLEATSVWTYFGRNITSVSCQQARN